MAGTSNDPVEAQRKRSDQEQCDGGGKARLGSFPRDEGPASDERDWRRRSSYLWRQRRRANRWRCSLPGGRQGCSCDRPPVAHQMKEDRRGENDRIEPIDEAAMAGNEMTPILDAAVALDRRHDEAAEKAHHHDDKR